MKRLEAGTRVTTVHANIENEGDGAAEYLNAGSEIRESCCAHFLDLRNSFAKV
jgi:hypothetical protein